jgi:hypothetical protein
MAANAAFLEAAGSAIEKGLRRMGPRLSYDVISADEAMKALTDYESQPRYSSEFLRKIDGLAVGEGVKTNAPLNSIKSRVSSFARKSGKRFKVFAHQNWVYIVRKEEG